MAKRLEPITPGDILREEFMAAYGLSQNKLALALRVPVSIINRVVHNKYRITADLALRFPDGTFHTQVSIPFEISDLRRDFDIYASLGASSSGGGLSMFPVPCPSA